MGNNRDDIKSEKNAIQSCGWVAGTLCDKRASRCTLKFGSIRKRRNGSEARVALPHLPRALPMCRRTGRRRRRGLRPRVHVATKCAGAGVFGVPRRHLRTVRCRADVTNNTFDAIANTAGQCRVVASDATTDATKDAAVDGVPVDADAASQRGNAIGETTNDTAEESRVEGRRVCRA